VQFASFNKALLSAGAVAGLVGCAAPAPDLPRTVSRTYEAGYIATNTLPQPVSTVPTPKTITVVRPAWTALSQSEQEKLSARMMVSILEPTQYGTVLDVQGADQSTAATNGGAIAGGAIANAAYVDRALRGGNYSLMNQLAIGVVGAAIGSNLDKQAVSKFQFRYTVRQGDGEIQYFDEVKSTSFRHSVGVCLTLPTLELVSQKICNQTPEMLRAQLVD
jgi:outer membrane lipoprotein SlyB